MSPGARSDTFACLLMQYLAMPEVVPVSRRVRNLKVCGHENKASYS